MIANALKRSDGNINYPGLIAAWSAKGKTNDDADKAILKDLTGNGHDITLNGFAFSEMSGYGGYNVKHNFTYTSNNRCDKIERLGYKLTFINIKENYNLLFAFPNEIYSSIGCKIKVYVKGIPNGGELYFGENKWIYANKDGIYEGNVAANNNGNVTIASLNCIGSTISVEFLPEYPDALVFDGVDDYGSAVDFGGKKIKTVISKYQTINSTGNRFSIYFRDPLDHNNYKRIYTKQIENYPSIRAYSDNVTLIGSFVSLKVSSGNPAAKPFQITGHGGNKEIEAMAFYSAYLFDRSLDEQEIKAFIRKYIDPEYLLPSEILTPDCYYDFSQGSNDDETRDTIKDYSGNGNDAVAHNFAWSGMSGYGGYSDNFNIWENSNLSTGEVYNNRLVINNIQVGALLKQKLLTANESIKLSVKVTGMPSDYEMYFSGQNSIKEFVINKDGIYDISLTNNYGNNKYYAFRSDKQIDGANIIIELIPLYPDALVFDGVDDYISLDAFDSGFKTMFMVCNQRNKSNAFLYDQRKNTEPPYDYGLYTYNSVAYNMRNANGTYINGIKNTKVFTKDLNNKKILISVNSKLTQLNKPTIGVGITGSYSDMALYKFLGFKKALTEEQIQAVIKKYKLLDGVDEIEVS